jgi:hypothetical protein
MRREVVRNNMAQKNIQEFVGQVCWNTRWLENWRDTICIDLGYSHKNSGLQCHIYDFSIYTCLFDGSSATVTKFQLSRSWVQTCESIYNFFYTSTAPLGPRQPKFWVFEITLRHTNLSMTPLDEGLARHTDRYMITHSFHQRRIITLPAGFEPAIAKSELPQTYALDRTATPYIN